MTKPSKAWKEFWKRARASEKVIDKQLEEIHLARSKALLDGVKRIREAKGFNYDVRQNTNSGQDS